jgi:hypothetical protein
MSGAYDPNTGTIWYVPRSGTGVCPLSESDIERVVPGDTLFRGTAVDLDIHYLITRDRRIIEYRYTNDEFNDESITYREISPADFIVANCPPDGSLPEDLSWIRAPQASQSDSEERTADPSPPSRKSAPEADPVPVEVISAAYALRAQGKPVSVRAACKKSGHDRKHFTQTYPEAVKTVEMIAAPDRQPMRGSKTNGSIEAQEDDD